MASSVIRPCLAPGADGDGWKRLVERYLNDLGGAAVVCRKGVAVE